jgi:hypothetical protein
MTTYRDPDTGEFISAEEYFSQFEDDNFDYEDSGSDMDGFEELGEGEY